MTVYSGGESKGMGLGVKASIQLFTVSEVMSSDYPRFDPKMPMEKAVSLILAHPFNGGPVCLTNGKIVGFLSERDCLRRSMESRYHNYQGGLVESYMKTEVQTISLGVDLFDAINLFTSQWFHMYPVVDSDDKVLGVVTRKALLQKVDKLKQTTW